MSSASNNSSGSGSSRTIEGGACEAFAADQPDAPKATKETTPGLLNKIDTLFKPIKHYQSRFNHVNPHLMGVLREYDANVTKRNRPQLSPAELEQVRAAIVQNRTALNNQIEILYEITKASFDLFQHAAVVHDYVSSERIRMCHMDPDDKSLGDKVNKAADAATAKKADDDH